jgi:hypothetical protein
MGQGYAPGPIGQRLRYVERIVSIARPDTDAPEANCVSGRPFRIAVAGDLADMQTEIEGFESTLFWSVIVLGVSMTVAMALFVRLGPFAAGEDIGCPGRHPRRTIRTAWRGAIPAKSSPWRTNSTPS